MSMPCYSCSSPERGRTLSDLMSRYAGVRLSGGSLKAGVAFHRVAIGCRDRKSVV